MYIALKHAHLTFVLVSVVLFYLRFYKKQIQGQPLPKLLKIIPHVNDTLLLISAAALCVVIQQYPLTANWLTIKVGFVIGYIIFGFKAIKATEKSNANMMLAAASICLILTAFMAIHKGV